MDFKEIGTPKRYVLFISPKDYFGTDGYKMYADTLFEALMMLEYFNTEFVRMQRKGAKYSRILFAPEKNGCRKIEGGANIKYVDRIIDVLMKHDE